MQRFVLDTDHLTLFDFGKAAVTARLAKEPKDSVGLTAVTVAEYLRGRVGGISKAKTPAIRIQRYELLTRSLELIRLFSILPYDAKSDAEYENLRKLRLRIGTNDLRIGALAVAHKVVVVTRNRRDFGRIPSLAIEDWSV